MKYDKRGVSAQKTDVHEAIKNLDKGLFADCFCKVLPDYLGGDPEYAVLMHADTAGTKTSLAYIYWRETNDASVWRGIAQDAIVMNVDDLACAGVTDNIVISSTIGRNKQLIPGTVLSEIINGTSDFIQSLKKYDVEMFLSGGETADVGDIVRTIDVGITAVARIKKKDVVRINIQPGDVIVGLESTGKSTYENFHNSGIGSNGLTFARHETLIKAYADKYPESFNPAIESEYVYSGNSLLTDKTAREDVNVGQMLLSPTRTYLPVLKNILAELKADIHGIIHCTGGGQTKILHFTEGLKIIKDNLFPIPEVFQHIQAQSNSSWEEMFQVFNMGHRLEIYLPEKFAQRVITLANKYSIQGRVVGRVEEDVKTSVLIKMKGIEFIYDKK